MTGQAPEHLITQFITNEQVSNEQLGIVKRYTSAFIEQPSDRELFITGLLSFGTISNLLLS